MALDLNLKISPYEGSNQFNKSNPSNSWNQYVLILVIANIIGLFFKGYPQDLGYWTEWVRELAHQGYSNFSGNYPPIYIHWLWLVSRFYLFIGVPIEANSLLKFLTQLPVLFTHIALAKLCFNYLNKAQVNDRLKNLGMMLCILNPAILINGPVWGQVDIIPIYFACLAIHFGTDSRYTFWMAPFFILSLLTKFQMIALAPLFGLLFFHRIKQQLLGIILGVIFIALAFLPFIVAGQLHKAFFQAYVDTLGQYPLTTFNAANIWILLTGNAAPDTQPLFGEHTGIWKIFFTAKYFGMICFAALSLIIFIYGLIRQRKFNLLTHQDEFSEQVKAYAFNQHKKFAFYTASLCCLGFFTFLPAMHERYLVPAVILSCVYFSLSLNRLLFPLVISLISAGNMLIIVELNGSDLWQGLAWSLSILTVISLYDFLSADKLSTCIQTIYKKTIQSKYFNAIFVSLIVFSLLGLMLNHFRVRPLQLNAHQHYAGDFVILSATQDHGKLTFNHSFDGNILSVGDKRFQKGFGTHANSEIKIGLPDNAKTFSFIPGLDDEVGTADVVFSVWGDNQPLWTSNTYYGNESAETYSLDVRHIKVLTLKVDALKDDRWDHADWVNPVIELEE